MPARDCHGAERLAMTRWGSACTGASGMPRATWSEEVTAGGLRLSPPYRVGMRVTAAGGGTPPQQGRNGSAWCNGEHIAEMRVRVPPPASSLSLMGHDGCESSAALGIRAGEDPAIYGGVVQAASHDPGEGEARAHIREKQVRGLPPPIGTGWTKNDGP